MEENVEKLFPILREAMINEILLELLFLPFTPVYGAALVQLEGGRPPIGRMQV